MTETNISVVMMTLNEADQIEQTLDSAEPMFDELVLIDGGSTDGTVNIAREWCHDHGKAFALLESSERELLLEGWGCQRRRGEQLASNDYTFALDADERVEFVDPDWFKQDFQHYGYIHTRQRFSGQRERDYRMYCPDPSLDLSFEDTPRWRGSVFEELRTRNGAHIEDVYQIAEAPFTVRRTRQEASATFSTHGIQKHRHADAPNGFNWGSLKKQHYLLERAMWSPEERYLSQPYTKYYHMNLGMIKDHWVEIRDEYDLPEIAHAYRKKDNSELDQTEYDGQDLATGEPVMRPNDRTWTGYLKEKLVGRVS